jgi:hypothetical protein
MGGSDLIRVVCHQCGEQDVCPSALMEEIEVADQETPAGDEANDE